MRQAMREMERGRLLSLMEHGKGTWGPCEDVFEESCVRILEFVTKAGLTIARTQIVTVGNFSQKLQEGSMFELSKLYVTVCHHESGALDGPQVEI